MSIAGGNDFVAPGKIAWTSVHRFGRNKPSAGLMAAPLPPDAALTRVVDFLVHERGWWVVSRTDESARLRRSWRPQPELDAAPLFVLVLLGLLPALIYLLAILPAKPVTGDLFISIVESDGEETILECVGRPYGRVKRSLNAVAQFVWT